MLNNLWRKIKSFYAIKPDVVNVDATSGTTDSQLMSILSSSLVSDLIKERTSERRWKVFKRSMFTMAAVVMFSMYFMFNMTSMGFEWVPSDDLMGVVRIDGEIKSNSKTTSADKLIPIIEEAFERKNVKTVMLLINSPGGQPAEADRITEYIEHKKKETNKEVLAVITDLGASAAYIIALHADKIYASKYSLVGSIGAILATWDFHELADRFNVKQHTITSGELKDMLNPMREATKSDLNKAQTLVDSIAKVFLDDVKKYRSNTLKTDLNYGTGEVWTGEQSLAIGLVDGLSSPDKLANEMGLKIHDFGPKPRSGGFGFSSFQNVVDYLSESISENLVLSLK
ncbi:MAG: S49 family peptidase [Methylophilus sp.]|uniref:S49 family peptidase n=1 Tax=Methylophilus sp. TaxID=29541 RepID=UPI003FA15FB8